MSAPRVTVIIVSWNALPVVKQCLPSVVETHWPNLELVFADNGSSDGSVEWISAHYPQVRIIRHPENWLFCKGNNEAIRQTDGDYVVLLNNDVEVPPTWLEPLVILAESDPLIAAIQPKILQHGARNMFEYAGAAGGFLDHLGYPFARGRLFTSLEPDHGQYDYPVDLDWASGAALLLRRSTLKHSGLLDEQFEMHMEEIDLCWRLRRLGYRITIAPQSQVYHIGGASLGQQNPRKLYFNVRNSLIMLYKNLPPPTFRRIFIERMLLDQTIADAWFVSGQIRKASAVFRAYWDVWSYFSTYRQPDTITALPSYRRSILIDYLLRGARTFTTLKQDKFSPPIATGP